MALAMIEGAEARGVLRPGMRVVEFTGGSTGSSLAMVCAAKGYRFVVLSSDAFSREKLLTMQALGAELRMVPSDSGKVTPALFERFKKEIAVLANEPNTFWTDQFHNEDAVRGYMAIGRELLQQTGGRIDAFCGAVGTGGMLRGVSRALRDAGSQARIVALEPLSSPALTEGRGGGHRVEGIGTGSVPPHMVDRPYDEARAVDEADARAMAKQLAREEGLLVGTSSGLNIAAAVQLARELGPGKTVATVAVDTGLKYLAGDLFAG
jgi:cysteine synthase A